MQECTFRWLNSWKEIEDVRFMSLWHELAGKSHDLTIFNLPVLGKIWLATKGKALEVEPRFCLYEDIRGNIVLLPFCTFRSSWRNTWERRLIGIGEPHFDYQSPLAINTGDKAVDWEAFWRNFHKEVTCNINWFDMVMLLRIRSDLAPANAAPDLTMASPYIKVNLYTSFDEYLSHRPTSHRTDVRRQKKRLAKKGDIELRILAPNEKDEAFRELDKMISAYEDLWAGQPSSVLFRLPGTLDFYKTLIDQILEAGFIHFSVLKVDGISASWHFGFLYRGVLHYYKPTYSIKYANYSPSKIHLAMLVEHGIKEGLHYIDLGGGAQQYKYLWTDNAFELSFFMWRTATIRSKMCQLVRKIKKTVQS